ncbi:hypothetical protein SAMN05443633_101453 [Chryseobacterium arachidis]|uniref:MORN repeat variant n=1 Tax=Chryseobacterium arachidis TaxID=1416778 RepID=A0A1M4UAK3_9FLAO|nr:hypothetical protein [Chryseobacterium arachidis]SHE53812.1 hypothetical protein SAMN05443633_101453 [Chryseobacterium arachidis]
MKKIIISFVIIAVNISCKTKINQYVKDENNARKRHGKWEEVYIDNKDTLITKGKYRRGEKVGIWKTLYQNKLYEKNRVGKKLTRVKRYFPDGTLMESGQTRLDISPKNYHWYYIGEWKYYSREGKLLYKKIYYKDQKADSISFAR